ncbi:hypothetical protein Emag_003938 [Eimeria magna]
MARPPPRMHISMPSIASELFFSSEREGEEELSKRPLEKEALVSDEPTLRGHSTTSSLPDVGSEGLLDSPEDDASEIDSDIFVDLSRELAAIEKSDAFPAPHSHARRRKGKTQQPHQLTDSNCIPLSQEDERTFASQEAADPIQSTSTSWITHREALKQPRVSSHVLRFAEEARVHPLHAGPSFSFKPGSTAFFARENTEGGEEEDSHTDSDLASLLGSIEDARRRLQAQEASEAKLDAALYAGGLSYFSRSAAATSSLLCRGNTNGPRVETSGHLPAFKQTTSLQAGPVPPAEIAAGSSKSLQEKTTYPAALSVREGGALTTTQGRQQLREGASFNSSPSPPEAKPNAAAAASAALQVKEGEATIRLGLGLGGEGGPQTSQERMKKEKEDSTRADLAAEKELAAARGAASLAGRVAEKIREWQEQRGSPGSIQKAEDSRGDGDDGAAQCLEALEALIASTDADASLQASQLEVLQRELLDCREAKRQTELQAESLRNEIGFLQLVNKKLSENREAQQTKALESLKQHVQEKTEETRKLMSERDTLRRDLDLLRTRFAEQLAAAEAAKAAVQHELSAAQHVFALKQQDLGETVDRLTRENALLRQHKEAAEKRLLELAQAEQLIQLERKEMKDKQQRLATQHEALKKSLQEIRTSALEARKKWQEKDELQQSTAAADVSLSEDNNSHHQRQNSNSSNSNSNSSSSSSKGHDAAGEMLGEKEESRVSNKHTEESLISTEVPEKLSSHDTPATAITAASATAAAATSRTKAAEAGGGIGCAEKGEKPSQLTICDEDKRGQASREAKMHERNQKLKASSPVRLSPMRKEAHKQREAALRTTEELALKSKAESTAPQTLSGDRDWEGEARERQASQPRVVRGDHHIDLGLSRQNRTLLNANVISRPQGIEGASGVSSPRRGEHGFELNIGGAPNRVEEAGGGIASEEEALVDPITTVIVSPVLDFSGSILLDSPPRPPVFISRKNDKEINETPEPESARSLYTAKLQEVEEANEMLRHTNMLVDRENAFLIKTLQGLKKSPGADSPIHLAATRGQQRVFEAAPVSTTMKSPVSAGERADRSLLFALGSAAASEAASIRQELRRPGESTPKSILRDSTVVRGPTYISGGGRQGFSSNNSSSSSRRLDVASRATARGVAEASIGSKERGRCLGAQQQRSEAPQDSADALLTQQPCAQLSEGMRLEAAATLADTALASSVACKDGESEEELLQAPCEASCSSPATPLPDAAEQRGAPTESHDSAASDEAPLTSPSSHGPQAEFQENREFASVNSKDTRGDDRLLPFYKEVEAKASTSCEVKSSVEGSGESAAEDALSSVSDLQRGVNEEGHERHREEDIQLLSHLPREKPTASWVQTPAELPEKETERVTLSEEPLTDSKDKAADGGSEGAGIEGDRQASPTDYQETAKMCWASLCTSRQEKAGLERQGQETRADSRLSTLETPRSTSRCVKEEAGNPATISNSNTSLACSNKQGSPAAEEVPSRASSNPLNPKATCSRHGEGGSVSEAEAAVQDEEKLALVNSKKTEMASHTESSPAVSEQRGGETPQHKTGKTSESTSVPSNVKEEQQSKPCCMQAASAAQAAPVHLSRERPRCATTVSDSSCCAAASTQLLVAEAGRSFKLKFLQHRHKATLDVPGDDWDPPTAASPHPLPRTPLCLAQHKTMSELCVLPHSLMAPLATGSGSGLTLPSSRRCEACLAAACDRILAEASLTPGSLMRKLASSPSRHLASSRSAGTALEASDLLATSGLSPTAAAAVKQLAAAALRGNASNLDIGHQGGLSGRTNGQGLLKQQEEGEREGGTTGATSPTPTDRRRFSAADPRDLLRLISSEMCRASNCEERTKTAKGASKGARPRSSSAATPAARVQQRSSSISAAAESKQARKEEDQHVAPASGVRPAPVRLASSSAATRRRPAGGSHLKPIVQRASSSSGIGRLEKPQPSAMAATRDSPSTPIPSSKTKQETLPLMRIGRSRLLMQTKEKEDETSRLKASTRLRKRTPVQSNNTDNILTSSRPASPELMHANKARPTSSTSRGRFPGERPPWDFSCAPLQQGPRMPFRSLLRK